MTTQHFGFTWKTTTELEFLFLLIQASYKSYKDVLYGVFYRTLSLFGVAQPRDLAAEEERQQCISSYSDLKLHSGFEEAFQLLYNNGFKVQYLTTADAKRLADYFERAGVNIPQDGIISCNTASSAKPALSSYKAM